MSRPENHVQTVQCPECGKNWTGHFAKPPKEAVCKDCARKLSEDDLRNHPDQTINKFPHGAF